VIIYIVTNKKTSGQKEIIWRAAEYEYFQKDVLWYFVVTIIGLALIVLALWKNNFLFAIFIIISTVLFVTLGKKKPRVVEFKINDDGVGIGKSVFYKYENIESFDAKSYPDRLDELILKRKSPIHPFVRIPIDSEHLKEAKKILSKHLEEKKYEDSVIDSISDTLGF